MEDQKKCSSKEHEKINAIIYYQKCEIYMCNKCKEIHSKLCQNHQQYILSSNNSKEEFTGFCKEENHHPLRLEYFCKDHNKLCCAACLCKIKKNNNGFHKDCNACCIEEIKDEKKNKLKENIKFLEDVSKQFEKSIEELKLIVEEKTKDIEEIKLNILKIFTNIRNKINEREDELLKEIDKQFDNLYINEEIIKESAKFPNKINILLEKCKKINTEWDDNKLNLLINDCINIENNIKEINAIKEKMEKCELNNNIDIKFICNNNNEINSLLENIKNFGKLDTINKTVPKFKKCPINMNENRKYIIKGEKENIITNEKDSWIGVICDMQLKGLKEYKWKIKILKSENKNIMIGVAPSDYDINSSLYKSGWYLYFNNSTLYSGPPHNYKNEIIKKLSPIENEVIVIMNLNKKSLKFIINNEDKGDSYTNIPLDKPLSPAVILADKNDSVQICEC